MDDEPYPFWTGEDAEERVTGWMRDVKFDEENWGQIGPCKRLNGPTGKALDLWLQPLVPSRDDCWITDCLDTYRLSEQQAARISDTYAPFAEAFGLTANSVAPHPDEKAIVTEACAEHLPRLKRELGTAEPSIIVTLGNAALRTLRNLVELDGGADPGEAVGVDDRYGVPYSVQCEGRSARWYPLAHPAAPKKYQDLHSAWRASMAK